MARHRLVDEVVRTLLTRIAAGEFGESGPLPAETVLAEQCEVSRLTLREGVKVLTHERVLRSEQGKGTFINPVEQWTSVEAIVLVREGGAVDAIEQLVQVRAMIEIGATELFVSVATPDVLEQMDADIGRMREAHEASDVLRFVEADLAFHDRIIAGCGNPFVQATFAPISSALRDTRERTSSVGAIRLNAIEEHTKILEAIQSGSVSAGSDAMRSHLVQTRRDAHTYLAN